MSAAKDWRGDSAPLLFFAVVIGIKTYGRYRRIRHPLNFGEIVHTFGVAILAATPLALFVVAVGLQGVRTKIEERKFRASVPE